MCYNDFRATKPSIRRRELSATRPTIRPNPKQRLLNLQKRQRLKELLIEKFEQKYNVKNPGEVLEPVITKFLQQEKLNDTDLKLLDIRIKNLLKDKSYKDNLKSNMIRNLQEIQTIDPVKTETTTVDKQINNTVENDKNTTNNEFPTISNVKNAYFNTISNTENNDRKRGKSSYMCRGRKMNCFKNPEEELAFLEKEYAEDEAKRKSKYNRNKERIEYDTEVDDWYTIVKYNKRLYDRDVLEEKMRDKVNKKRTKDFLDHQVSEKIKREYEDELKEKEYNKIIQEHNKKLDEMEQIKAQKIKEQIQRLKDNRDEQLKIERTRKKIEELKQKKVRFNFS